MTVEVPDTPLVAAVIVAVPLPEAVTSPVPPTVATAEALLAQVTGVPVITCPFWSRTWALSWIVAPNAVSRPVAGLTSMIIGRGGSGSGDGGSVAPSPQPAAHVTPAIVATTKTSIKSRFISGILIWRSPLSSESRYHRAALSTTPRIGH